MTTKWDKLALEVRCALSSEGMTKPRWNRLPVIRRQHMLLDALDAIFDQRTADATPVWTSAEDASSEHVVVSISGQRATLSLEAAQRLSLELVTAIAAIRTARGGRNERAL